MKIPNTQLQYEVQGVARRTIGPSDMLTKSPWNPKKQEATFKSLKTGAGQTFGLSLQRDLHFSFSLLSLRCCGLMRT